MASTHWVIAVKDPSGAIDDAKVAMVLKSAVSGSYPFPAQAATHTVPAAKAGTGLYSNPSMSPSEDEWLLVVSKSGFSPVVQKLTLKKDAAGFFVTRPKGGNAATVDIKAKTTGSSKTTNISVQLHPATEIVHLTGIDTHGGTRFRTFAEDRAKGLLLRGLINDGTMHTIISAVDFTRETFVPQAGGGFTQVRSQAIPAHSPKLQNKGKVSVTDFYSYLNAVGGVRPNTVREAGIFSHAFIRGPIIVDTLDGNSGGLKRDPTDADGRPKDFNSTNAPAQLRKAFRSDAEFQSWGCFATEVFNREIQQARADIIKGTARDAQIRVSWLSDPDDPSTSPKNVTITTIDLVKHEMDLQFRDTTLTYGAAAAAFFGFTTRQTPPGIGASFLTKTVKGVSVQVMSTDIVVSGNANVYDYFVREFGATPHVDVMSTGYFDYDLLRAKSAVPRPSHSSVFQNVESDSGAGTSTATLGFQRSLVVATFSTAKVTGSAAAFPSGLGKATAGHRHIFSASSGDQAFFIQSADEGVFKMHFDGGAWVIRPKEKAI